MILKNKTILIISPEPWQHIFVSKHHYAVHLAARGNKIIFLNPPSAQASIMKTYFENVSVVDYKGFTKGLRFYPKLIQKHLIARGFKKIEKLAQVKFDIVWSFDNSVFYDLSALPKNVFKISHIVDLNQDFNTETAAKTANLCLGVKIKIVERLKVFNTNSHLIFHGVQTFLSSYEKNEFTGENRIKALYIGNLGMAHIDWLLLSELADRNQNIDFLLLGDGIEENLTTEKKEAFNLPNVYTLGKIDAFDIPKYLYSADLLLTLYDNEYADNYATPHKMMEYLASGKMIVATWTAEYEELHQNQLILMARNRDDYFMNFKRVVSALEKWNGEQKQQARKEFAFENTYERQIERIESLINRNN